MVIIKWFGRKLKELASIPLQAHDDLVNSDFLKSTSQALPKCFFILISKITYCEYKCSFFNFAENYYLFKGIAKKKNKNIS